MFALLSCLMTPDPGPEVLRLWPGDAPLAKGADAKDVPTLTRFPSQAKEVLGTLIVFPGGGYGGLADHEGRGYASFFSQHGYDCYVLKYRLGSDGYRNPAMRLDAERAIRIVRSRTNGLVGIIGSSAGGHLAATAATKFSRGDSTASDPMERLSSRPDFAILCYPVITMGPLGHAGSRDNLIGANAPVALVDEMSLEKQVRADMPPCFLWHTADDAVVPVENSQMFARALSEKKVPFELHIYASGHHGLGLGHSADGRTHPWVQTALVWLRSQKP